MPDTNTCPDPEVSAYRAEMLRPALPLLLLVASACSPILAFNSLMPRDGGTVRVAKGEAYGPGARARIDVYAPEAAGERPLPVIVFFYGGSWRLLRPSSLPLWLRI